MDPNMAYNAYKLDTIINSHNNKLHADPKNAGSRNLFDFGNYDESENQVLKSKCN